MFYILGSLKPELQIKVVKGELSAMHVSQKTVVILFECFVVDLNVGYSFNSFNYRGKLYTSTKKGNMIQWENHENTVLKQIKMVIKPMKPMCC